MIIGIEETTDHRSPETRIRKFRSVSEAERWLADEANGAFAWSGATGPEVRPSMQNFHRRVRYAYVMPVGFRLSKKEVEDEGSYEKRGHYGRTYGDQAKAIVYRRHAVRQLPLERGKR